MKTFRVITTLVICSFCYSCHDYDGDPPPPPPDCKWTYYAQNVLFQPVKLHHPYDAENLDQYVSLYDQTQPIWCFSEVFGESYDQKKDSQIKVVTTLTGCNGTKASSNLYTNSTFAGKIGCVNIDKLDRPENGTPSVTLEIKAGPHHNQWWEKGFVVWTKTFTSTNGNPYINQNGTMYGVFIKNPTSGSAYGQIRRPDVL